VFHLLFVGEIANARVRHSSFFWITRNDTENYSVFTNSRIENSKSGTIIADCTLAQLIRSHCGTGTQESLVKKPVIAVSAAALLLGSVTIAMAQDRDRGASESAPGQQMLEKGSKPGSPGASGYAPGHQDRDDRGTLRDRDDRGAMDRDRK
jgi:hypothetical protein